MGGAGGGAGGGGSAGRVPGGGRVFETAGPLQPPDAAAAGGDLPRSFHLLHRGPGTQDNHGSKGRL